MLTNESMVLAFISLFSLLLCSDVAIDICAETIQRIRERTRLAMQDPKVMSCKNNFK